MSLRDNRANIAKPEVILDVAFTSKPFRVGRMATVPRCNCRAPPAPLGRIIASALRRPHSAASERSQSMVARCVKKQRFPWVSQGQQHAAHAEHVIARAVCRVHFTIQMNEGPGEQRADSAGRIDQPYAVKTYQLVGYGESITEGALLCREHVDGETPAERDGVQRGGISVQAHGHERRREGDAEESRHRHADGRPHCPRSDDAHTTRPLAERGPELLRQDTHHRWIKELRPSRQAGRVFFWSG